MRSEVDELALAQLVDVDLHRALYLFVAGLQPGTEVVQDTAAWSAIRASIVARAAESASFSRR
jgi:hypothetical protein